MAQNAPEQCGWLFRWYDEIYTLSILAVQHHFLNVHSSSFSEYYYDLKRKPVDGVLLSRKDVIKSLVALVVFPYLHDKLEQLFKEIKDGYKVGQVRDISLLKKLLYWIYPYLHASWNGLILYYNFMFATGKSKYHCPTYHLFKLQLVVADPFAEQTVRLVDL